MFTLSYSYGNYRNFDAPERTLYYLSSFHEDKKLLYFGSPNMVGTVEDMAWQIRYTQQLYKSIPNGWQRMYHFVVTITKDEMVSKNQAIALAVMIGNHLSYSGFQNAVSVFKVQETKDIEIHAAFSSIDYCFGHLFHATAGTVSEQQRLYAVFLQYIKGLCKN